MDHEVRELLDLIAYKLSLVHPGNVSFADVRCEAGAGVIHLTHEGQHFLLHLPEAELRRSLREAPEYGVALWGSTVTPLEAAARLTTIHLEESLATRDPHPGGRWTYDGGFFEPLPPWEVHQQRHR